MDDPDRHRDELGDLLFQIVFQAALRERDGDFDLGDVIATIRDKLLRRHPHVFGAAPGAPRLSPQEVSTQWEAIKAAERRAAGRDDSRSSASKVSRRLPALIRTGRMQDAASKLGFDWPSIDGAVAKFREEWDELEQARRHAADDPSPQTHAEVQAEFGDLLFVLVRIGQKLGLDAEQALRGANDKFERRFAHVLARCEEHGLDPATAGLDTLEGFWTEAKRTAPAGPGPGRAAAIDGDDPSNA
jgi:MazG family protein